MAGSSRVIATGERPSASPLLGRLGAPFLLQRGRLRQIGRNARGLVRPHDAELLVQLALDVGEDPGMELEEVARVLAALADALAPVAEPGAALLDDVVLHRQIEQVAFAGDALAVEDVELDLAERRGPLLLLPPPPRAGSGHPPPPPPGAAPAAGAAARGAGASRPRGAGGRGGS